MTKEKQLRLLLKCVSMLSSSGLWNNPGAAYYWKLVKYAHTRGILYVGFDGEDIDLCVIAYRVNEVTDDSVHNIPEKEEGETLYVLVAVSKSKDKLKMNKLKKFFLINNPDVKKIALHHRGDKNKLRIYEVNSVVSEKA